MKKKYINIFMAFTLLCAMLISCMDNNVNTSLDNPSEEEMEGDYYLLGGHYISLQNAVIHGEQNPYQFNESLTGHPYGRYMSITNDGWNDASFSVFNAPMNWLNSVFNDQLIKVYSTWFEIENKHKKTKDSFTWAWAELLRVSAMHRMTDMYGPIPYSEIKKNTGAIEVAYDNQEDVYKGLMEDLNESIRILSDYVLSGAANEESPLKQYDNVYDGDFAKWVKYANSLKLRMAMRMVYVDPAKAKLYAEEAVNHPIGVMITNDDNAWVKLAKNPISVMWGAYGDSRICADLTSYMIGYNDPRLTRYIQPTKDGTIKGLRTGIKIPNKAWAQDNFSSPNIQEQDPLLWMCAAEITLLRAEGVAVWGWNMGESAEKLYNDGIRLSFAQWNAGSADSYLLNSISVQSPYSDDVSNSSNAMSTITIRWDDAASKELKQERVLTQKWIAMFPLGHEAWAEQRRTGYPRFFPVVVNKSPFSDLTKRLASRLPYANSETTTNAANYNKALEMLGGGDYYNVRLWWDKKSNKPNW